MVSSARTYAEAMADWSIDGGLGTYCSGVACIPTGGFLGSSAYADYKAGLEGQLSFNYESWTSAECKAYHIALDNDRLPCLSNGIVSRLNSLVDK